MNVVKDVSNKCEPASLTQLFRECSLCQYVFKSYLL